MTDEHINNIAELMLSDADKQDRKMSPARIAQLKESYAFFKTTGLDDDAIKKVMNLTAFEMQKIRNLPN